MKKDKSLTDICQKNIYKWPTVHEKVVNVICHLQNVIKSWDTILKSNIVNDVQFSYIESRRVEWYNYFGKLVGQFLIKVNTHPPSDTVIPLRGFYFKEVKIYIKLICERMLMIT